MKMYNAICPCCGHSNYDLYLEETEGWMECEECGEVSQVIKQFVGRKLLPVYSTEDIGKLSAAGLI